MPRRGSLRGALTWRVIPEGATAPGRVTHGSPMGHPWVTHVEKVKGKTNLDQHPYPEKNFVIETSMTNQNQHVLGIRTAKSPVRWSAALLMASPGVSQCSKICTKCIRNLWLLNSLEKVAILLTEKLVIILL